MRVAFLVPRGEKPPGKKMGRRSALARDSRIGSHASRLLRFGVGILESGRQEEEFLRGFAEQAGAVVVGEKIESEADQVD